jgi:hypothetical protein
VLCLFIQITKRPYFSELEDKMNNGVKMSNGVTGKW